MDIDNEKLINYVDSIKLAHDNGVEVGLYYYKKYWEGYQIGVKLFLCQKDVIDDIYSVDFKPKYIFDYDKIKSLTCEEHLKNSYNTCGCLENNLLDSLCDDAKEYRPCSYSVNYKKIELKILKKYLLEVINASL